MDDDKSPGAIFGGGVIIFIILCFVFMKAVQKLFIEMGKTFDIFAVMAKSLFVLLWQLAIDVGLIAAAVAAIYFTYRYIRLVRSATDLKKVLEQRHWKFHEDMASQFSTFRDEIEERVFVSERKLAEFFEPPIATDTVKPEEPVTTDSVANPF
jgi:hypothetical protein